MKQLQHPDKIISSLNELKDELHRQSKYDMTAKVILMKINSCLFNEYPVSRQKELSYD